MVQLRYVIILFLLSASFHATDFAQLVYRLADVNALNQWGYNRVGTAFWSAGGAGIGESGLPTAPINNPAGMTFDRLTIAVEGSEKFKTEYLFSDLFADDVLSLPSYACIGISFEPFAFAVGYCQGYNARLSLGTFNATTESQPEGTGQMITLESKTKIHTIFASSRWQVSPGFSVGATVGVDMFRQEETLSGLTSEISGNRLKLIFGSDIEVSENICFGLSLQPPSSAILNENVNFSGGIPDVDSSLGGTYALLLPPRYLVKSPLMADAGLTCTFSPMYQFSICVDYQDWSTVDASFHDRVNVRLGLVLQPVSFLSLRAGFFTDQCGDLSSNNYFDQQYFTAGVSLNIDDQYTLSAGYLTSKPFTRTTSTSSESFYQRTLTAGAAVSF
jgi:hypothetical protein